MPTFTKILLSGSLNGRNIPIASTSSLLPTPIHTAVTGSTAIDEIWLWANNVSGSSLSMSIMFGGSSSTADNVWSNIAPQDSSVLVIPGWCLQNGLVVQAYSQASGSINLNGFVNRIV